MAGKMKNCPVCGKLFIQMVNRRVCHDCLEKEQEMEKTVVDYVRQHPKCSVTEAVKETGVSEALVKRLIREGRFEQLGIKLCYPCEKCGKPIVVGKMCQECTKAFQQEIAASNAKRIASQPKPKPKETTSKGGIRSKSIL